MKAEIIMSHITHSHFTMRSLHAIGSERRLNLVDNSFGAELQGWAKRNPFVNYLRPKVDRRVKPAFIWSPLTCAESWNWALKQAESEWVINVNPDTLIWPNALEMIEGAIEGRPPGTVLIKTQVNFNIWFGHRQTLLDLGGFDTRFEPCGAEDEDMLCRISEANLLWSQINVPAQHMEGGHKSRYDGYCNTAVFKNKWGWPPHSKEYRELVTRGRA